MSERHEKPNETNNAPTVNGQRREEGGEENQETHRKNHQTGDIEQSKKHESRMMNFFNQEFIDRKIDFKPK